MITNLENRFEDLKEKYANAEITLIFTKFETEKLLDEIELALSILSNSRNDDKIKKRFIALQNQAKEFDEFLADLIEAKHKPTI